MTITYPIEFPTDAGMVEVTFNMRNSIGLTESPFTYKQQAHQNAGQRWEADITIPQLNREDGEELNAFLAKLKGRFGTFLLGDPLATTPMGVSGGTPVVDGAGQTGATLRIRGLTAGTANVYLAGDWFQLGSGSAAKLHKILNTVTADYVGDATLDIWPDLRSSPSDGAALTVNNPRGVFRLSDNLAGWKISKPYLFNIRFSAIEVIA